MSIFLYKSALFGFVAPIAALKVKVDWSSIHFSQNFNIRIKRFSSINVRQVSWEMFETEGGRSGGYRGKLDQSIIHG